MKHILTGLLAVIFANLVTAQNGLIITPGAQLTVSGNVTITLQNADLINNGTFEPGNGSVRMTGTAAGNISGNNPAAFFNLLIANSAGIQLQNNISIINQLELVEEPIGSRSAVEGLDTLLETYTAGDATSLASATSAVVAHLLKEGHTSDEIVVLSLRGAESSALLKLDELAQHRVKKIVGRTAEGDFIFSDGDLVVDTVFRFKGRSANCVVLSEIDFHELNENTKRRLFVGMTRARLRLALVCTTEAAEVLSQKINE